MAARNALVFDFLARDRASGTFDKIAGKSGRLSSSLGKFAKRAAFAGGAAGVAFGTTAVKGFLEFDDAMTQSLAIMGDISGPMKKRMEKAARDVGKTTRFSATQAAESYFFLASAGFDAKQSVSAMPQVAKFAQAGMFDMALATDLATDAQSALGLKSKDAGENLKGLTRVTDVLVKANSLANASVEQFSVSLTQKAGTALRNVGKDIEEGVAVLAVFADQGIKAERAGTILRATLDGLSTQARKNKDAFAEFGVRVFDSNGKMRNMAGITRDLEKALAGMSTKEKEAALAKLGFNLRSREGILALMGNSKELANYEKKLRSAGGATDEVAKKQLKGFLAKLDLIKSKVQDVALVVGEKLVTSAFAVGEKLAPLAQNIISVIEEDVIPSVREFFKNVDVASWAKGLISSFTDAIESGDFGPFGKALGEGIGDVIMRMVDLGVKLIDAVASVDWVGLGIKAGKLVIPFAIGMLTGIINSLTDPEMWGQLGKHWQDILLAAIGVAFLPAKWVTGIARALAKIPIVGKLLAWIVGGFASVSRKIFRPVARFLGKLFKAFADGLTKGGASRVVATFTKWLSLFPTRIGVAALDLVAAGRRMITKFGNAILKMAGFVGKVIGRFIGWVTLPFRKAGSWLIKRGVELVKGLMRGITSIAKTIGRWLKANVIDRITSRFSAAIGWLVSAGKNVIRGLKNGVLSIAKTIGRWFTSNVKNPITGAFAKAGNWLFNKGKNLIGGLKDGVVNAVKGIAGWVKKNIVDPIITAVKKFFGINSPSKVMMSIGGHLITGLVKGMGGAGKAVAKKAFGDMPTALAHLVGKGLIAVKDLPRNAVKAITDHGGLPAGLAGKLSDLGILGDSNGLGDYLRKHRGKRSGALEKGFAFPLNAGSYRVGVGINGYPGHTGQDFPAATGTPVYSPFNGFLTNTNLGNRSYGMYSAVQSGAWKFIAAHLSSFARPGGPISKGELLGSVGSTGNSTGSHLHAEMRRAGTIVNPRSVWKYAKGGMLKAGRMAMVGEDGPELIKLREPGRVFNNGETDEMMGSGGQNITVHGPLIGEIKTVNGQFDYQQVKNRLRYRGLR